MRRCPLFQRWLKPRQVSLLLLDQAVGLFLQDMFPIQYQPLPFPATVPNREKICPTDQRVPSVHHCWIASAINNPIIICQVQLFGALTTPSSPFIPISRGPLLPILVAKAAPGQKLPPAVSLACRTLAWLTCLLTIVPLLPLSGNSKKLGGIQVVSGHYRGYPFTMRANA